MSQPPEEPHQPHDFVVRYRFYSTEEGGRYSLPFQGYRSDFKYADKFDGNGAWMIYPEFEDENGEVIQDRFSPVPESGTARMAILSLYGRAVHRTRIKVGTKGYFVEGSRAVAECEVIEIVGLMTNPAEDKR